MPIGPCPLLAQQALKSGVELQMFFKDVPEKIHTTLGHFQIILREERARDKPLLPHPENMKLIGT